MVLYLLDFLVPKATIAVVTEGFGGLLENTQELRAVSGGFLSLSFLFLFYKWDGLVS